MFLRTTGNFATIFNHSLKYFQRKEMHDKKFLHSYFERGGWFFILVIIGQNLSHHIH